MLDKYPFDNCPLDKGPLDKCPTTIFISNVLYDFISERLDNPRIDGISINIDSRLIKHYRPDITLCKGSFTELGVFQYPVKYSVQYNVQKGGGEWGVYDKTLSVEGSRVDIREEKKEGV